MPFLIRNDTDGREYEIDSLEAFDDLYADDGFHIVDPQPYNYTVPERPKPKQAPKGETRKRTVTDGKTEKDGPSDGAAE